MILMKKMRKKILIVLKEKIIKEKFNQGLKILQMNDLYY